MRLYISRCFQQSDHFREVPVDSLAMVANRWPLLFDKQVSPIGVAPAPMLIIFIGMQGLHCLLTYLYLVYESGYLRWEVVGLHAGLVGLIQRVFE